MGVACSWGACPASNGRRVNHGSGGSGKRPSSEVPRLRCCCGFEGVNTPVAAARTLSGARERLAEPLAVLLQGWAAVNAAATTIAAHKTLQVADKRRKEGAGRRVELQVTSHKEGFSSQRKTWSTTKTRSAEWARNAAFVRLGPCKNLPLTAAAQRKQQACWQRAAASAAPAAERKLGSSFYVMQSEPVTCKICRAGTKVHTPHWLACTSCKSCWRCSATTLARKWAGGGNACRLSKTPCRPARSACAPGSG